MATSEILVVGGGVIGAAVARSLAMAGNSVTIVDSGSEPGIATQASAGMLAPLAETGIEDPLLGIYVRARDLYGELAPELREATGVDVGLWTEGITRAVFTPEEEDEAKQSVAWHRQQGLNSEWLTPEEVRELYPGIAEDVRGGLLSPEDGALDPLALLEGLLVSAANHGAEVRRGQRVSGVTIEDTRVAGVETDRGPLRADAIVLAAGAWSGQIEGLPRPLSVQPVRGQMVAFDWPTDEPPAIIYTSTGYALRRGAELVAGSTMEYVGFDASVTDEGIERIQTNARRLYPALGDAPPRRTWAGLRPGTPDGQPLIGRDPEIDGLWYATGHGRNGILLAAITGEILAGLFTGEALEYDLAPLAPGRFWAE